MRLVRASDVSGYGVAERSLMPKSGGGSRGMKLQAGPSA
jgi:hypothetical protein